MESKKELYQALANFQQEVPIIHKETQGYGYTYADLPTIFPVINPILKKNGLGFTQLVNGDKIHTIVFHCETGQTIESITDIPQGVELKGMNQFQTLGSAITYIRRYALSSILGLVTDKDTDAGGEEKKAKETPTNQKNKVDVWLTESQFEKLSKDVTKASQALDFYDGKTTQQDGKVYGMKKDYRLALDKLVTDSIQ